MATRTLAMDFQVPKITHEEVDEQRGVFVIEPLDRGFGHTFGNSLRRVLLSSLEGAAVTHVKFEGVDHEYTSIPGVYAVGVRPYDRNGRGSYHLRIEG